ncbi:hypothetical protein BFJ72_g11481 [Fusarium proliferatum]|uniref:Heterokaryon incompatibility domain-containing protein n=1 Tax=Gibberella intermedia TaxID=948311 RepID=A0A420SM79_GIBIN|nr:hypothetical protein BFJ72_g11481 [Fusarium proliferatum]
MDKPHSDNYHIAIVAPLLEDYETARALLDEPEPEYLLKNSGAACSVGKVGSHNVVLVGRAEDMTNVSAFVNVAVDRLLETYPSIRAGFLIGVDATAHEESLAKPGDIVVAFPQENQPGQVQFDVDGTAISSRICTTFEINHLSSCIKSVINTIQSPEGRQHWGQYLQYQSSRTEFTLTRDQQPLEHNKPNKILRGKVASSAHLLSDRDLAKKFGCDSKIMCFERAGASIKSRFPILTVCGILGFTGSSSPNLNGSAIRQIKLATVIYTMFVSYRISTTQLEDEYAFTDRFQYKPFDLESAGFRLVLLEKGTQPQLRCRIVQAYLDEKVIFTYEALSYSWGWKTTQHEIVVDGKILSITESLYDALYHLRNPDEDRMLWVDALCIDQNNIKERGHQVNRMGEIYKKADRVIIWLGYLSGGNVAKFKSAVDIFKEKLPLRAFREWAHQDERWQQQWKQTEASIGLSSHSELVDGLQIVMGNPWFSRAWILQEVANAKRAIVKCNLGEIPAKLFCLLPYLMGIEVSQQCQAVLDIMPCERRKSSWWGKSRNLCHLLWKFRECQATDPRDRVYALLGMASDVQQSGIRADYAKEEQVVLQELYAYLSGEQPLAHLSLESKIQDFQRRLPDISRIIMQQELQSTTRTDLLEQRLLRQGSISQIDSEHLFRVMKHGSNFINLFLDKSKFPFRLSSDDGLQVLQRFPDGFEILLQRPGFVIDPMPDFVAGAMEYRPQLLERLLTSSNNPEQLRYDAILKAIPRSLPSCRALLDKHGSTVKVSKEMLMQAVVSHRDVLQYLLTKAQAPVMMFENLSLEATPGGFHIINEDNQPVVITKDLIIEGIMAGADVLQLYLVTLGTPIELEEDLFIKATEKGLETLNCMLSNCTKPFNITKKAYRHAVKGGNEILSYLFPESTSCFQIAESRVASELQGQSRSVWLSHIVELERNRIVELEKNQIAKFKRNRIAKFKRNRIAKFKRNRIAKFEEKNPSIDYELSQLLGPKEEKLQITDKLIIMASTSRIGDSLRRIREAEQDVPEDVAIKAIEDGSETFTTLLNKPGTNFRVTKRIREVASGYMYAFEALRVKRLSEVFPDSSF